MMPRPRARWSATAVSATAGLSLLACAKSLPPSGGPEDRSPPKVLATSPALFESGVGVDRPLWIAFSEPMDRSSAEDGIVVRPHVGWRARAWKADTLHLFPTDGWAPETTYTLLLRRRITDHRRNAIAEPAFVVFSTADSLPRGRITGRMERIAISEGDVLMLAFAEPPPDTLSVDPLVAVSVGEPDKDGRFLLPGLRVGHPYEIGAFFDINEDRDFDPKSDLYCRAPSLVTPDSAGGPRDVLVTLVWADEPGAISGAVTDSTCAALNALRARQLALRDSLQALRATRLGRLKAMLARADSLYGEAVAPERAADGNGLDSLRALADSLRAAADTLTIPDSLEIRAVMRLPREAITDSAYCALPITARFWSRADTGAVFRDTPSAASAAYRIEDVPPGAYEGLVWRDLDENGLFDRDREPGAADTLRLWVPAGRAGVVDTLVLGRPATFRWEGQ